MASVELEEENNGVGNSGGAKEEENVKTGEEDKDCCNITYRLIRSSFIC
jgi:hypothetical protein